jgi:copper resistance protein B
MKVNMSSKVVLLVLPFLVVATTTQSSADDTVEVEFSIDELERQWDGDDESTGWGAALAISKGVNSFNVVSEGGHAQGDFDGHEMKAYYGRALSDSSAFIIGWRGDMETDEHRHWLLTGFEFVAPADIEMTSSLFLGENDLVAFRLETAKEFLLTEKLTLVPEVTIQANATDDPEIGAGSGLSDIEVAARMFYEVTPELSTYVGAVWGKAYGDTADYLLADNEGVESSQFVIGLAYTF